MKIETSLYNKLIQTFSAIIFDFDGTLFNSMPAHNQAWIETFKIYNCDITPDELQSMAGTPNTETAVILCNKYQINADPHQIVRIKEQKATELLIDSEPFPDVLNVVYAFYQKLPLAIVSGSHSTFIKPALQKFNLEKYFVTVVASEDTQLGKPHPDPFLEAARRLNVKNVQCLVFEDGLMGIEAAHKAHMKTIFVTNGKFDWEKIF